MNQKKRKLTNCRTYLPSLTEIGHYITIKKKKKKQKPTHLSHAVKNTMLRDAPVSVHKEGDM